MWLNKYEICDTKNWAKLFLQNASDDYQPSDFKQKIAHDGLLIEKNFGIFNQDISQGNMSQIACIILSGVETFLLNAGVINWYINAFMKIYNTFTIAKDLRAHILSDIMSQ